jgi:hypothetical protein
MIRIILRRILAWQPRRSGHPYLAMAAIPLTALAIFLAVILLA